MVTFAKLYNFVEKSGDKKNDKHKFLMGSLYALAGLLKIEAKSFIKTMDDERKDKNFKLVAPLANSNNSIMENDMNLLRTLNEDDIHYFRSEFYEIINYFTRSITLGLENQINNDTFNDLLDLSYDSNYDKMKEMEK